MNCHPPLLNLPWSRGTHPPANDAHGATWRRYDEWPHDALHAVAHAKLQKVSGLSGHDDVMGHVVATCVHAHAYTR